MKKTAWAIITLLVLAGSGVLVSLTATAERFEGCMKCVQDTGIVPDDHCEQVGDQQTGEIYCEQKYIWDGHLCVTSGGACFNVDAGGGGGEGGGGGGGGGACTTSFGGWCPPECMSCERQLY